MYKLIRDNRGFTLTELLIAVLLMSVITLGVTSINVTSRQFLIFAGHQANVQREARFAMEHMMRNIREGEGIISITPTMVRVNMPAPIDWIQYEKLTSPDRLEYTITIGGSLVTETIATGVVDNPGVTPYFLSGINFLTFLTITITVQDGEEEITLISAVTLRNS